MGVAAGLEEGAGGAVDYALAVLWLRASGRVPPGIPLRFAHPLEGQLLREIIIVHRRVLSPLCLSGLISCRPFFCRPLVVSPYYLFFYTGFD